MTFVKSWLVIIALLSLMLSSTYGFFDPNSVDFQRKLGEIKDEDIELYHALVKAAERNTSTLAETCIAAIRHTSNYHIKDPLFYILAEIKDKTTVPALLQMLENSANDLDRGMIGFVLGEIGDPRAVKPLMNALAKCKFKEGVNTNVQSIIGALGDLRDTNSIPVLVPFLDWKDSGVINETAKALRSMGYIPKDPNTEIRYYFALSDWVHFRTLGSSGVYFLIDLLKDKSCSRGAAIGLANMGGKDTTQALVAEALVGNKEAYDALHDMEQPDFSLAGSFFIKRLREMAAADGLSSLRFYTVQIGYKIGEPIVEPLLSIVCDGSSSTAERLAAAEILTEIEKKVPVQTSATGRLIREELLRRLRVGDLAVIAGARRFFIERGDKEAESLLVNALDQFGMQTIDPQILNYSMVGDLLNCGNDRLESAARDWAKRHGFEVSRTFEFGSLKWGKKGNEKE